MESDVCSVHLAMDVRGGAFGMKHSVVAHTPITRYSIQVQTDSWLFLQNYLVANLLLSVEHSRTT